MTPRAKKNEAVGLYRQRGSGHFILYDVVRNSVRMANAVALHGRYPCDTAMGVQ